MRIWVRILLAVCILYGSWIGMMALHELGHIAHAALTGGRIIGVSLPLAGFSQTFVDPNPYPSAVSWGGPLWGSILPLAAWMLFKQLQWRGQTLACFFAGFCCIANGTYLGIGWIPNVGDAADLLQLGTPLWILIGFGVMFTSSGLYQWHRLGSFRQLISRRSE